MIAPGMFADFIILNDDLMKVDEEVFGRQHAETQRRIEEARCAGDASGADEQRANEQRVEPSGIHAWHAQARCRG